MEHIVELLVSFLSGSLVCGVITLLIQRKYKKNDEQRDIYINLRKRLCHYKDDISNVLILFLKTTHQHCNFIDKNINELNKKIDKTSLQIKAFNIEKECVSCENRNSDECSYFDDSMDVIDKKIESIQKGCNEIKKEAYNFENYYWQSNEEVYNIIGRYKSLSNDLGLIRNKSISFVNMIGEIDESTLQIISLVQESKSNNIVNHFLKLIKQIDKTIVQLDQENN